MSTWPAATEPDPEGELCMPLLTPTSPTARRYTGHSWHIALQTARLEPDPLPYAMSACLTKSFQAHPMLHRWL